jgi:hypothetical protein
MGFQVQITNESTYYINKESISRVHNLEKNLLMMLTYCNIFSPCPRSCHLFKKKPLLKIGLGKYKSKHLNGQVGKKLQFLKIFSYKKIFPSLIFDLHHFELPKCSSISLQTISP